MVQEAETDPVSLYDVSHLTQTFSIFAVSVSVSYQTQMEPSGMIDFFEADPRLRAAQLFPTIWLNVTFLHLESPWSLKM